MRFSLCAFLLARAMAQTPDECAVWRRELSFAQSVERHDAKSFAAHLHAGAVFNAGTDSPVRGRDAVVKAWTAIIAGKELRLRWHPDVVNIGGDPGIAISRGPFVMEDRKQDGTARYRVGTFMSIWLKQAGQWVVLFDGGGPPPMAVADAQAAEAFLGKARASCPAP